MEEQGSPVLQILREVDKEILPLLDPVTRIAVLHKSHMLLTYYLDAEAYNWETMPAWLRPLPSQIRKAHPLLLTSLLGREYASVSSRSMQNTILIF